MSDMGDGITSAEGRLLAVQMGALRDDVRDVKDTMRGMAKSLEQLVRIEEQQKDMRSAINRAFDDIKANRIKIDDTGARVSMIEQQLPGLKELRRWVIGGILSGNGMIATAVIYWFFQHHVS